MNTELEEVGYGGVGLKLGLEALSVIVLLHTSNHTITPSIFVCVTVLLLLHTLQ